MLTRMLFLIALSIASSAKADISNEVAINWKPLAPVVSGSDSVSPDGRILKAPWFEMQLGLQNLSAEEVGISAIRVDIIDRVGNVLTTRNFVPADFDYDMVCKNGVKASIKYNDFGLFGDDAKGNLYIG